MLKLTDAALEHVKSELETQEWWQNRKGDCVRWQDAGEGWTNCVNRHGLIQPADPVIMLSPPHKYP